MHSRLTMLKLIREIQPVAGERSKAMLHSLTMKSRLNKSFDLKKFTRIGSHSRGTAIKAVAAGAITVVNTDPNNTAGIYVIIDHGGGLQSIYGHMIQGSPTVTVGQRVSQGDIIGQVDSTGHSTGDHLHLGAKLNGTFVNPRNYLPAQ